MPVNKSSSATKAENKSHRTKEELAAKEMAENVKSNRPIEACKQILSNKNLVVKYDNLITILESIGRNDALYETIINRYIILQGEIEEFEEQKKSVIRQLKTLTKSDMDQEQKINLGSKLNNQLINIDKQIMTKRKMLLDIEKECGFTIVSASRVVINHQPNNDDELLKALRGD